MSAIGQLMKIMALIGRSVDRKLDKMTRDPLKVQTELLMSILEENKDTEYGREHGFADIHSVEEFQSRIGLGDYDTFAPYIERMVRGEENVLVKEHIQHYNKTSGTVGFPKYIPLSQKQIKICGKYFALHSNGVISSQIGYGWNNGKGLSLQEGTAEVLPTGATYGCASSVGVKGGPFKNFTSSIYTSPVEARQPEPGVITRYIHARFGLAERNVTYVVATFSSLIMDLFTYIENNHELLVRDIANGTIDESVDLPDSVRASLLAKIRPDPKRAEELREAFSHGFDTPWARRVWKDLQYMYSAGGANFQPYTDKLQQTVFGDEVKIFYLGVSASEGFFSAVYKGGKPDSLLTPDGCFMEFRDADDENAPFLTMDKLEVGKSYELVVTNFGGLYRYRMRDVFTVTGFHNKTPLIVFRNRAGYAANICGEKTSEAAIRLAVRETEKALGLDVYDYSIYPDADAEPPTYVMFLEITRRPAGVTNAAIRERLQEEITHANRDCAEDFETGRLAPVRLIVLQPETYMLYRDVMIMKGTSAAQLKPINVIRNEFQRKFLSKLEEPEESPS